MQKILYTLIAFLMLSDQAMAQGEENIWAFGDKGGLDFSSGSPVPYATNIFPGQEGSAAVCDAAGQLLFYTNGFWVWNRDHEIMPELTGGVSGYTAPIATAVGYPPMMPWNGGYATQATAVARRPAHPDQYYLFSMSTGGQLYYSLIDMNLNSGKGGIVSGKKGISLATNLAEKLTVVKGCNNIWVMTRAKSSNQYRAYAINDTGIVTTPVVSAVGDLPLSWYRYGVIKFSADGSRMAAACNLNSSNKGGLELYDFNAVTGVLSNPLVLDSSSTLGYYYGTCFSPDGAKLYASTSSFPFGGTYYSGKVRQFDLSLGTAAAIIASNTVVFTDPGTNLDRLGDMKRGRDGKIYFSSGKSTSGIHVINFPDLAGTACNAVANVLLLSSGYAERGVPNDIAFIPVPDTLHTPQAISVCFRDSVQLAAGNGKHYVWDNGSTEQSRTVFTSGTYVVSYINTDCAYQIDSLQVHFIGLPTLDYDAYTCPGAGKAKAWLTAADTSNLHYRWTDESGMLLQEHWSKYGDSLIAIDTGVYQLQISTASGCDTTFMLYINPLPLPIASFEVDSIACKGQPVHFNNTSTAPAWKWHFGDGNFSASQDPDYAYAETGDYTVSLVVANVEGCTDTATKEIVVKSLELSLRADKTIVNRGEQVRLQSSAPEPYTVTAWEPTPLFANQTAEWQELIMDTTRTIIVSGLSEDGCPAEASIEVSVRPVVLMPSAFSPNGDGLNDRFRPMNSGYILIRFFEIYNRYGQQVYAAQGSAAKEGWDGSFKGQPMPVGVYYYQINIETSENETIYLKGDVSLLR